jgi:GT2 family glycosyltransferase
VESAPQRPIDLSICIVTWNGRQVLRGLLESLRESDPRLSVEVLVVDNASTDGSAEMVAAEFAGAVVLRNDSNLGFARANNLAAERARGRLLLFLNNDTVVRPGALWRMVSFLDANPQVAALSARLTDAGSNPRARYMVLPTLPALLHRVRALRWTGIFRSAYRRYRRGDFDPMTSQPVAVICGSAMLVRREQFLACGGWDVGFSFNCEDFDLSARLGKAGVLYYLADAEIVHLGGVSSRSNLGYVYRGYECGCARYLKKHSRSAWAPWIYKLAVTIDMPVRIAALGTEYGFQLLKRRPERARRVRSRLSAASQFLVSGLGEFWRS